jgi:hypothetical protein
MILEKELLLANYWGGAAAPPPPPPPPPRCYGPGLGVGLGYYVNELQRPLGHLTRARI